MIHYMNDIRNMMPLLVFYSRLLEDKAAQAKEITVIMDEMDGLSDEHHSKAESLGGRLDVILEDMLCLARELRDDFGITICDPKTGRLNIPCYSNSSRTLVFICYDHTCTMDPDKLMCHPAHLGHKDDEAPLTSWDMT